MQIETGLFSQMVLQRTKANKSRARFTGTTSSNGAVTATVCVNGKKLNGWSARRVGSAAQAKMGGSIDGLPVGGPYDITLAVGDEMLAIKDVLVGNLWLLAGQSNMEGVGWLRDKLPGHRSVRAFYMNDEWDVAVDPVHTLWCSVDRVHGGDPAAKRNALNGRFTGVGPGVAFGQELQRRSGIPQGLIACAHGGTSMSQWSPALKKNGGASLFGAMCRRIAKNGGAVAGMFWYQGESDASAAAAPLYTQRMKQLIASTRKAAADAALPVVIVQLGTVLRRGAGGEYWSSIREQQRTLPEKVSRLAVVTAVDLPMDDPIHISGAGQHVLGRRAAQAMLGLRRDRSAGKPTIDLRDVTLVANPVSKLADVVVRFSNVEDALRAEGRPSGFSLDSAIMLNDPYRVELAGDRAIVHLGCQLDAAEGDFFYGAGFAPYCNLSDAAGRAVPAFGPIALRVGNPRALTPFITRPRISAILPPSDMAALEHDGSIDLKMREFATSFCDLHAELAREALVYYAFDFRCAVPMQLNLLLGYDGPVKVWLDGAEIFRDLAGTNPARPEDAVVPFGAEAGDHKVLVALGSHGGAWGVFLRLERTDVSQRALRRDPRSVLVPEILL